MKKIVMIGNGNYSKTLEYYIKEFTDWDIQAYADEFEHERNCKNNGKPFVNINEVPRLFPSSEYDIVLAIGYSHMNDNRKRVYNKLKQLGYSFPNLIHPTAVLHNLTMGDANIILENTVFGPNCSLGSNNIIWAGVLIRHDEIIGDHNQFSAGSLIAGNVRVGNNCFLGIHSTVKEGVFIDDYTLVGANAYISRDTQKYDVIVPARSIKLENRKSIEFI